MSLSNFVESLSDLLTQNNLKPSMLADALNCGRGTVSRYLNGQKMPSVDLLIRMANFFDCSTDYLLGRENEKYPRTFKACPTFQKRLPALCKELKTTKAEIRRKTGIAESAIYNWQCGKKSPTTESIIKIADAFDCSVDFVLGRSNL